MKSAKSNDDMRPTVILIAAVVAVALVFLAVAHIFYIQSLIVVWGGAIIWGSYVYDKRNRNRRAQKHAAAQVTSS